MESELFLQDFQYKQDEVDCDIWKQHRRVL